MKSLILPLLLFAGLSGGRLLAEEIFLPVPPADLLKLLPPASPEWRLTVSNAQHIKQNPLKSKAIREYVSTASQSAGTDSPPAKVSLMLVDTCGDDAPVHLYRESAEGGGRQTIANMPALRSTNADGSERISVLMQDRFLLFITGTPKEQIKPEDWISKINQSALKAAAGSSGKADGAKDFECTIQRVDELNPKRNSTARFRIANETL